MKQPETHEDLALSLLAKWELEDELRAIEELLADDRMKNVGLKRAEIARDRLGVDEKFPAPKKKSKR